MRGRMRSNQHNPEIVNAKFVPMETLLKESPEAKKMLDDIKPYIKAIIS
jgi:hypothetical protein